MENLINNLSTILIAVAIICTVTSIITQFTKEWGMLKKVPTSLVVVILSTSITLVVFIAFMSYKNYTVTWYMFMAAVVAGIVIAYITCNGWDSLIKLFKRFYKKDLKGDDENDI